MIKFLIVGLVAGWLANKYFRKTNPGLLRNLILGVAGSYLGGWIGNMLGLKWGDGWIPEILIASGGAFLVLWLLQKWNERDAKNNG